MHTIKFCHGISTGLGNARLQKPKVNVFRTAYIEFISYNSRKIIKFSDQGGFKIYTFIKWIYIRKLGIKTHFFKLNKK